MTGRICKGFEKTGEKWVFRALRQWWEKLRLRRFFCSWPLTFRRGWGARFLDGSLGEVNKKSCVASACDADVDGLWEAAVVDVRLQSVRLGRSRG